MANWFVQKDGREQGPFTSQKLKKRAATGTLRRDDLVRREDTNSWVSASSVKGLFSPTEPGSSYPPLKATTPVSQIPSETPVSPHKSFASVKSQVQLLFQAIRFPAIILSVFTCCVPVGLALIWTHPAWSQVRKIIWTIAVIGFPIFMVVFGHALTKEKREELNYANLLWQSGDKIKAISKYRSLLHVLNDSEKPLIFGRLIDWDAENGNPDSAMQLLEQAHDWKVVPSVTSAKARVLVAKLDEKLNPSSGSSYSDPSAPFSSAKYNNVKNLTEEFEKRGLMSPKEGERARERAKF